jgi:hypothetical protein
MWTNLERSLEEEYMVILGEIWSQGWEEGIGIGTHSQNWNSQMNRN